MRWFSVCLVFAALIALTSKDANAAHWIVLSTSNSEIIRADVESIRTVDLGRYKSIWTANEYKSFQTDALGNKYKSVEYLSYIDCDNQELAMKSLAEFKSNNAKGSPILSHTFKNFELDFNAEPPGTNGYVLINFVCKSN